MELLVYFIKVNVGILFLYSVYRLFLRQDTFFRWKRIVLLAVLFIAFLYPFVDMSNRVLPSPMATEGAVLPVVYLDAFIVAGVETTSVPAFSILTIASALYLAIALCLIIRLLVQFVSVLLTVRKTAAINLYGMPIRVREGLQTPFSFFGWIVLDPAHYAERELKEILLHEETHVRQGHSFDTVVSEIVCAVCWLNPCVWLLRKEIRVNLEYLADRAVLQSGCEAAHYQFHLLQLSYSKAIAQITNNFNVSLIKKRITMMNKNQSSRQSIWKYTLLVPTIAILVYFNTALKAESPVFATIQEATNDPLPIVEAFSVRDPTLKNVLYFIDDKEVASIADLNPDEIDAIEVLKDTVATNRYGERAKGGVILITTKKQHKKSSSVNFTEEELRGILLEHSHGKFKRNAEQGKATILQLYVSDGGNVATYYSEGVPPVASPKPDPKYQALTELVLQTFNSMPAWISGKRNEEFVSVQIFPGEENEPCV
ncbi:hypothetical protein SAMD00024442_21_5 [Candidatus Symbiothrix dinenymphae]|nr:hypothetical protein SAMD00024442_21_5 [Candidatus Symbiothrix dinenymphae]